MVKLRRWTPEEDKILSNLYPLKGAVGLLTELKHPKGCIRARACALGIVWIPSKDRVSKLCRACKIEKPKEEFRLRQRMGTVYLSSYCRTCEAKIRASLPSEVKLESVRRWRKKNPERVKELDRQSRVKRKDKIKLLWASWYSRNRRYAIEKAGKYARDNKDRLGIQRRKHYAAHLEKSRAKSREQYAKNPEPTKRAAQRRRARKSTTITTLTAQEWKTILEKYEYRCAYCGREVALTLDHVIPLVRGGSHSADNVVPACKTCNCSKGNLDLAKWLLRGGSKVLVDAMKVTAT